MQRSLQPLTDDRTGSGLYCLLLMLLISFQSGCQVFNGFRSEVSLPAPVVFREMPSRDQLLAHLASQSRQIRQIQSDVRVTMDGMPTLRGTMAVERPDRLRLTAGLLGVPELGVDVGSNDERFWFWTKVSAPGQEPGIYFANHGEYRNSSLHQLIPIEPGWLIDALGLVDFRPDDRIAGPFSRPDGRFEIRTYRNNGDQQHIRVSVIDPAYGWISQQAMYNGSGRLMAYANSKKYQHYPEYKVNLPSWIELIAYDATGGMLKITVDASPYKLNSIYGDPEKLWSMPNPGNVRLINLATGQLHAEPETQSGRVSDGRSFDHRTSGSRPGGPSYTDRHLR